MTDDSRLEAVERKAEDILRELAELRRLVTLVLQQVRQAGGGS